MKLLSERLRGEADCAAGSAHPAVVQGLLEKATMAQNLESAVEKMRGALKPFADFANLFDPNRTGELAFGYEHLMEGEVANCQRAHDVLEEMKGVGK